MIYYVSRLDYDFTIRDLIHGVHSDLSFIRPLSYERLFAAGKAPAGNYIFTDYDRLTPDQIHAVSRITDSLRVKYPQVLILNDPRHAMERYALLKTLYMEGMNHFNVTRLDGGARPDKYPVFIRSEDGAGGAESGLCQTARELEEAIRDLVANGKILKRRIAVQFHAKPDSAGYYRKYGAFNINGVIVPQHLLISREWMVKYSVSESSDPFAAEELEYVRSNPHRDELLHIFKTARIDFGRIDYGIVDGAVQTYEINTNPTFPHLNEISGVRSERRLLIYNNFISAFEAINASTPWGRPVRFILERSDRLSMRKPRFLDKPLWMDRFGYNLRRISVYRSLKGWEKNLRRKRGSAPL